MTSRSNVRPPIVPLTEYDTRELLSKPLVDLCAEHGPTRVAGSVGCDDKTIRNARDEKATSRLDFAYDLLARDGRALYPILPHYVRRSDAVFPSCGAGALPAMTVAHTALVSRVPPHHTCGHNQHHTRQSE